MTTTARLAETTTSFRTVDERVDFWCYMTRRFPRPNEWSQLAAVEWNDGDKYPTWATYRVTVTPVAFKDHNHGP
jgi:hypothetical protein